MIQAIGLMIGFYIITRMVSSLLTRGELVAVKIFAVITILVCVFSISSLLLIEMPEIPKGLR